MEELLREKEEMVERQLRNRGIRDEAVLSAMQEVPREEFVRADLVEFAYRDAPLPIEENQTISQPYIVALMAELMQLKPGDRVLDVGTGSGYAAAVMSRIVSDVYSVERHEALARSATERIARLGFDNVHILHGDGTRGWPEHAPFDAVNVAAGGTSVPQPLKDQLSEGGRLIIPVGTDVRSQRLLRLTKRGGRLDRENLGRVQFVPLIGEGNGEKTGQPAPTVKQTIPEMISRAADPVPDVESADIGALIDRIGEASVVLLGEATHGTAEFYDMRARITRELIETRGFSIVAVEADWTDAAHIDYYVRDGAVRPGEEEPFTRFPVWMWRNEQVRRFIQWLKHHNSRQNDREMQAGFYGLDLYNMYGSIAAIIEHLEEIDPDLADTARERYGCLTPYQNDPATYGAAAMSGRYRQCEEGVIAMLRELLDSKMNLFPYDGEQYHHVIQNARLIAHAEEYYRSMYHGSRSSWNLRDSHMSDTLESLLEFRGPAAKAIVWAHNSHLGNAAATEMGARGEHNIGQLAREEFGEDLYSVGFGTDRGTVAAASRWGGEMEVMQVRPSAEDSYERLMHQAEPDNFMLPLKRGGDERLTHRLRESRLERAIGVIYRPETELQSHYFQASLPEQFDEFVWFDETRAVTPLQRVSKKKREPETFPFGV